jgi:hypothetical protein
VVACEILTAEIAEIDENLVQNDGKYLNIIFGFFHTTPEKFNVLLANLVVKLIVSLLSTHLLGVYSLSLASVTSTNNKVINYLKQHPEHITKIVDHLDCATITDLIIKIISCEEEYEGQGTQEWLVSIGLVKQIINRYRPSFNSIVLTI